MSQIAISQKIFEKYTAYISERKIEQNVDQTNQPLEFDDSENTEIDFDILSLDSLFLLVYASAYKGVIMRLDASGEPPCFMLYGNKRIMSEISQTESNRWKDALDLLIKCGYVKSRKGAEMIYDLTPVGEKKALLIKNETEINTGLDLSDEIKKYSMGKNGSVFRINTQYIDDNEEALTVALKECATQKRTEITIGIFNGKPIVWKPVFIEEDNILHRKYILLITKECITKQPYNYKLIDINWKNCSLRKWLNEDFYNCFSEDEKRIIITRKQDNNYTNSNNQLIVDSTSDSVFILSGSELTLYKYRTVKSKVAWWLRTFGSKSTRAFGCRKSGQELNEYLVDNINLGVRPAIWVEVSE